MMPKPDTRPRMTQYGGQYTPRQMLGNAGLIGTGGDARGLQGGPFGGGLFKPQQGVMPTENIDGPMQYAPQQQQQPAFSGVFNPQQTQEAVNRARNQGMGTTMQMLMQQGQRPGIRATSQQAYMMPQMAQARAGGQFAAQMIPFQHAQANAQHNLGMQQSQWNEGLGMANQYLNAQNQLNQYGLGNLGALADFFRMFL